MSACWTVKGCGNDPCTCYQQPVESAQQNEPNDDESVEYERLKLSLTEATLARQEQWHLYAGQVEGNLKYQRLCEAEEAAERALDAFVYARLSGPTPNPPQASSSGEQNDEVLVRNLVEAATTHALSGGAAGPSRDMNRIDIAELRERIVALVESGDAIHDIESNGTGVVDPLYGDDSPVCRCDWCQIERPILSDTLTVLAGLSNEEFRGEPGPSLPGAAASIGARPRHTGRPWLRWHGPTK